MSFERVPPGVAEAPEQALELPPLRRRTDSFGQYVFRPEVAAAVNVALYLQRPLLVTGEPGSGKTSLAWGIAQRLGAGEVLEFHAKSSSSARDLLYTVDDLRRFHDAHAGVAEARSVEPYLRWAALGEAIRSPRTRVVLIDEIDKAPRDFPNDLLNEVDRMSFGVPELGPSVRFDASVPHVVVITSNSERRLPPAFLRRCVYHHLEFPDGATLLDIVQRQTADLSISSSFREIAIRRFEELRAAPRLAKLPSTDELLSWMRVLHAMGVEESELSVELGELPALEVLVKLKDDLHQVRQVG